jgi:cytochrome c oxidase cbb3-type subunit 3
VSASTKRLARTLASLTTAALFKETPFFLFLFEKKNQKTFVHLALLFSVAVQFSPAGRAAAAEPPTDSGRFFVPTSTLFPGGGHAPPEDPRAALYDGNTQAISMGARLFDWYNCSGCHFHGAGGIGPALINPQWRYGGRIDQIHETLVQGRPNGMPSWGGKIPDDQLWQISAYVRSLSTPPDAISPK